MTEGDGGQRWKELHADEPSVWFYSVKIDDLVAINNEAKENSWGARWSSVEKLKGQVSETSRALLYPVFRNGGKSSELESFRCYVWFRDAVTKHRIVSLVDVSASRLEQLPAASSLEQLRKVARLLLEGYELSKLD